MIRKKMPRDVSVTVAQSTPKYFPSNCKQKGRESIKRKPRTSGYIPGDQKSQDMPETPYSHDTLLLNDHGNEMTLARVGYPLFEPTIHTSTVPHTQR